MKNSAKHTSVYLTIVLVSLGLFTMTLHPLTHVVQHDSDRVHEKHHNENAPHSNDGYDDCPECVLSVISSPEILSPDKFYKPEPVIDVTTAPKEKDSGSSEIGFLLRAPPFPIYV